MIVYVELEVSTEVARSLIEQHTTTGRPPVNCITFEPGSLRGLFLSEEPLEPLVARAAPVLDGAPAPRSRPKVRRPSRPVEEEDL